MSNAQKTYAQFYNKLVSFSNEVPSKLKWSTPRVLAANVGAIAQIIKPTDPAFNDLDVNTVVKYVMLTITVTEKYLGGVDACQYVSTDNQSWFSNEKDTLEFLISITKMAMASLRLSNSVEAVDYGPGGINSVVYSGMSSSVLGEINDLLNVLAEGC